MHNLLLFLFLIVLLAVMSKSAEMVVRASAAFGHIFRVRTFMVGLVILGLATSSPEIMVGINSALSGVPQLSLGNLLGETIALVSFLIGVVILINGRGLSLDKLKSGQIMGASIVMLAPLLLLLDGNLSRLDGVLLVLLYVSYLFFLRKKNSVGFSASAPSARADFQRAGVEFAAALIVLLLAAVGIVNLTQTLGQNLGIPLVVIGLLVLALGTALPELALAVTSKKLKQEELVTGNLVGSAAANSLILGVVAIIAPIQIFDTDNVFMAALFLLTAVFLFNILTLTQKHLTATHGWLFIALYVLFVASQLGALVDIPIY